MSLEAYHSLEQHTAWTAAGPGDPAQHRNNNRDIQPFGGHRTLCFSSSGDVNARRGVETACHGEAGGHGSVIEDGDGDGV